jgi:hypothetical protein
MGNKNKLILAGFVLFFAVNVQAQDDEIIRKLFQDAIETMGGEAYLNVKDMMSEGQFFQFNRDGDNSGLIKYVDYTKLPDKSRHEVGNKRRDLEISVFNLEKNEGWILEGQKETREAKPEEMRNFRSVVKHNIDTIFHFRYKDPENRLFYMGPGEGKDVTLEIVKIIDPENDETIVYFDRISKLPVRIEYRDVNSRGVRVRLVDEYSQWFMVQGVNTPKRIDGYVNGRRSQQTFVFKVAYNTNIADSFFSKPVSVK